MKVVVCQEDPVGGEPSREEMIQYWKENLAGIPEISSVEYKDNFAKGDPDEMVGDCDAILGAWINDDLFSREFMERHPNLKYVATFGHGYGRFDHQAAKEKGIVFCNTIYGDMTIAQFAFGLLLDICHNVDKEREYYKKNLDQNVSMKEVKRVCTRQIELYGKTIGIIGLGSIGIWMARMAAGFGMKVIAYSRHKKEGEQYQFIEQVSFDELLQRSDVISIHCPLTEETQNMINKETIQKMKNGVIILNTARGAIIDENALVDALNCGKVYAAGLDVVTGEPLNQKTTIFDCPNAYITAHIAWAPKEARYRTVQVAIDNFKNWLSGKPTSTI